MEEKILEIITNRINPYLSSPLRSQRETTAKEITAHVFEFMEWFSFKKIDDLFIDYETNSFYEYSVDEEGDEILTNQKSLPEVYDYWLKNVKE